MRNQENLKRQKLRNNEYYQMQDIQDRLYMQSSKDTKFTHLMEIITSEKNILLAYRNIKKNSGSNTKGADGKNISHLASLEPETLIKLVQNKMKNYFPNKVRRVEIPKPDGKLRPLGIPTIIDRLIQQCILQVLEPICEAKFYKHSYGFRPLRSTKHAISRAYSLAQKNNLHYVVDVDIKGFFDNINHGKLIKQLWTLGIRDKSLIAVISKMLKAEILNIGIPDKGTPQGGILSPLLANVVLNEFDWWIASQWETIPIKRKYASQQKDPNGSKYRALKKTKLKEVFTVRYADDFKLFCRNHQDAVKLFEASKQWLKNRLHLEVSKEKSKIVNLRKNYSYFLGIKFKVHRKGKKSNKDTKWVAKSHIQEKALSKIKENVKKHIKHIQKPKVNLNVSIDLFNSFVIGVHNYYNCATNCNIDMSKLSNQTRTKIFVRLKSRKVNKSDKLPDYIKKVYGKSDMLRIIGDKPILPLAYIQHPKLLNFSQTNIYNPVDREKIHNTQKVTDYKIIKYLIENPIQGQSTEYNDNRISLYIGQLGKCFVTNEELTVGNMEVHHAIPKSQGGNDSYNNLIYITKDVHKLIHATQLETVNKYLNLISVGKDIIELINGCRKLANNFEICL
ncbi:group II intron reverse transcriptase/maturase [Aliarcobacter cryaerophilus]|uniref:group II intron reverse transcriptase/maturase n=1 Tax=Aliarcobacter cryaerophilus TaxID=28198 RepID=UPI0021B4E1FA|nr:group II intron reverse transcriptase/maturase [Aliarcobacter cryaerophilus]MCT7473525.1 group II intron reverse transcriptase/maturase [Aliarcobacter cryaerophilus]